MTARQNTDAQQGLISQVDTPDLRCFMNGLRLFGVHDKTTFTNFYRLNGTTESEAEAFYRSFVEEGLYVQNEGHKQLASWARAAAGFVTVADFKPPLVQDAAYPLSEYLKRRADVLKDLAQLHITTRPALVDTFMFELKMNPEDAIKATRLICSELFEREEYGVVRRAKRWAQLKTWINRRLGRQSEASQNALPVATEHPSPVMVDLETALKKIQALGKIEKGLQPTERSTPPRKPAAVKKGRQFPNKRIADEENIPQDLRERMIRCGFETTADLRGSYIAELAISDALSAMYVKTICSGKLHNLRTGHLRTAYACLLTLLDKREEAMSHRPPKSKKRPEHQTTCTPDQGP